MIETAFFTNIGKRMVQQDRCGIFYLGSNQKKHLGAVAFLADGLGGLDDGGIASNLILETVEEDARNVEDVQNPNHFLLGIMDHAHAKVKQSYFQNGISTGSTMIIVYIYQNELYFASVGDSKLYLYRTGQLLQLNREHSYDRTLAVMASRGTISLEEAQNNSQRNSLSNYIGMEFLGEPDFAIEPVRLKKDDCIALMSDGVYGSVSVEAMESFFKQEKLEDVADSLERAVSDANKELQDNYTCIMMRIL